MKISIDMKLLKRRVLRIFFAGEILVFVVLYVFGTHGIQHMMKLEWEQQELDRELHQVCEEVAHLDEDIEQWKSTPFFKEKIAREQLQMAREGDEIYYVG